MTFNLMRFKTLLLREWLQNRWTWLIVVGILPALTLVTMPFGDVSLPAAVPPQFVAGATVGITAMVCVLAAWATVLFMAPGLARRDVQDRSIEFWLSLPSTHREHVGAQYLSHALLFPLGALAVGLGFGLLLMPLVLFRWQGLSAFSGMDWAAFAAWMASVSGSAVLGLVLAALWLSPLVMLLMAASAWVKRLALPLILLATVALANLPSTAGAFRGALRSYADLVGELLQGVIQVFVRGADPRIGSEMNLAPLNVLGYAQQSLNNLATPQFAVGVLVALACAAALILRRRR